MKPWQTSLNKAPNKGRKEKTKKKRTQVRAKRANPKVGHYGGTRTNHVPNLPPPPAPPTPLITRSISEKEGDEKLEKTISLEEPCPAMTKNNNLGIIV